MSTPYVQPGTFLANYMDYMDAQETPREYDFACACWCLSIALGRHTVVSRPRAPVHLNTYVILVSESGIMRKSSAIHAAVSIVRDFLRLTKSPVLLVESKITMGAILNELSRASKTSGSAQMVLVGSELAAMLGRGTSIAGVPALLTDLYDCPDERVGGGSLSTGSFNMRNVYCSFIAGSTPTWLETAVKPEVVAGGFTSRCYFIHGRERKRLVPWPSDGDGKEALLKEALVTQLVELHDESKHWSAIGINNHARETFSRWYKQRANHRDTYRESFESREDGHVLRFAGLFAANDRAWCINEYHIERAIKHVAEIKSYGTQLFTGAAVERHDLALVRKIRSNILSAGDVGISRSELYRSLNISGRVANEVRTIVSTMHDLDLIRVFDVKLPTGRPRRMYVATEMLRNELFLEDVARKLGME